jgi:hypothetical protein
MGARDRLRAHFLGNIGVILEGDDLRMVAGNITE